MTFELLFIVNIDENFKIKMEVYIYLQQGFYVFKSAFIVTCCKSKVVAEVQVKKVNLHL